MILSSAAPTKTLSPLHRWASWKPYAVILLSVAFLAAPAYWRLSREGAESDIFLHASIAHQLVESGQWFVYSIYYPLNFLTALGRTDAFALRTASFLLLVAFAAIKSLLVLYLVRRWIKSNVASLLITLVVLYSSPILNPGDLTDIYLGQFSANVWHNSTTALAGIFVIPVFILAIQTLKSDSWKLASLLSVLLVALTLSKPSYTIALLPIYVLMISITAVRRRSDFRNRLGRFALVIIPTVLLLLVQYYLTFSVGTQVFEKPTIGFEPFQVWSSYSANIPLSLTLSLAGPLVAIPALTKKRRRSLAMVASWMVLGLAAAEYAFMTEYGMNGLPTNNGNWTWAVIPAMSVLFFVSLIQLVKSMHEPEDYPQQRVVQFLACGCFAIHLLSGVFYVMNVGVMGFPTFVF